MRLVVAAPGNFRGVVTARMSTSFAVLRVVSGPIAFEAKIFGLRTLRCLVAILAASIASSGSTAAFGVASGLPKFPTEVCLELIVVDGIE